MTDFGYTPTPTGVGYEYQIIPTSEGYRLRLYRDGCLMSQIHYLADPNIPDAAAARLAAFNEAKGIASDWIALHREGEAFNYCMRETLDAAAGEGLA